MNINLCIHFKSKEKNREIAEELTPKLGLLEQIKNKKNKNEVKQIHEIVYNSMLYLHEETYFLPNCFNCHTNNCG